MAKLFFIFSLLLTQNLFAQTGESYGNYKKIKVNDPNVPESYFLIDNPLGKIYLSNQPFTKENYTDKRSFRSDQFIYGRLVLNSGTVKEALKINSIDAEHPFYYFYYEVNIYKNKKQVNFENYKQRICVLEEKDLNKNYLDLDVLPDTSNVHTVISKFQEIKFNKKNAPLYADIKPANFTQEGNYRVDIILRNPIYDPNTRKEEEESKWPTFEQDFNFEYHAADMPAIQRNNNITWDKAIARFERSVKMAEPLPEEWRLTSNASIVSGYTVAKYNELYTSANPGIKIIKTYLSKGKGWSIVKDNNNLLPVYKYCDQWVTFFVKDADGCYYYTCGLRQNYSGGGTYGPVFLSLSSYDKIYVDCLKMK